MKICRFSYGNKIGMGLIEAGQIHVCRGDIWGPLERSGEVHSLESAKLLNPVIPGKIIGIGKNYLEHAREFDGEAPIEPMIFLKAQSSVLAPGEPIVLPKISHRVDHEGELGVVIGKTVRNLGDRDPFEFVLGYCCVNDVTARDLQKKDVQFTRAKSFDTFCPFGPWIETELNPSALRVECRVNGQVRQGGNTNDMIFGIPELMRFVTEVMTLYPGDIISTGTPAGVGPLSPGDVVEVEVEGIGILTNPVISAP